VPTIVRRVVMRCRRSRPHSDEKPLSVEAGFGEVVVRHIEVFADIVCPFTYVGLRRLIDARAARDARCVLRVRAWPLELINGRPIERELAAREIEALRASVSPDLFAGFETGWWPRTSLPAFGLAAAAYALDNATGEAVSLAIRATLFEDGLDVADPAVLQSIADEYGVTPFDARTARASVENDWERGKAREVKGSPHFFVGDHDWFCPSLVVRHEGEHFSIEPSAEAMHEFYDAAFA
jgi:predicted DsbA family dithiol-disulfide isomerase